MLLSPCFFGVIDSEVHIVLFVGLIRLVQYLSQNHILGKERPLKLVVDAGTGTTAVGLGLGAKCLGCVLVSNIFHVC